MKLFFTTSFTFLSFLVFSQTTLKVVSWNVESEKNDATYIAERLKDFKSFDLIGLSEVKEENKSIYDNALGSNFHSVLGTTGRSDRLYIAFNKDKYSLVGQLKELNNINIDRTVRAPLFIKLKSKTSNKELIFMVNHLARGDKRGGTTNRRKKQAEMLNQWVKNIQDPVIAVGDYNFDFQLEENKHKPGLDAMLKNQNFFWIYPSNFQRTQCNLNYKASILDFIFVNRQALMWSPTSKIQDHPDNCKFASKNSDHKAILAEFTLR